MDHTSDAEAGHILTHLSSGSSYPTTHQQQQQQLTPSSSAQGISPSSSQQQHQHQQDSVSHSPAANRTQSSAVKRSRQRPTKSCEECRRKKLKCDRELPCGNCKKGGRDGSICYFKDAAGLDVGSASKRARVEDLGFNERVSRPYASSGAGYGSREAGEVDRGYYPNVPQLARVDPVALERGRRGSQAYEMNDVDVLRQTKQAPQSETRARISDGETDRCPNMPALARENNMGFGRGMFMYGISDVSAEAAQERGDELPTPVSSTGLGHEASVGALGRVHVKGSRSRYVGIGDRMAMLDHFGNSKGFIMRSFKDPEMCGVIQELAAYQNAFQPKNKLRHVIPQDRDELMVEMVKALPSSFLFGILQARYIQNWETIWRVLHIGTFMKECDQVSAVIESGTLTLPPHIHDRVIPQILAIISTASRLNDPNERGSATERISDDQITKNLEMVKAWLDSQHGKALVNFPTLQTRTLLLLARQANLATPSELWVESGILVRNAMVMGLHQDPEPWEFSKFDKEARRKLWLTIVELDLQFSLAAGMPSAVNSNLYNTRELLNVDDQDLTPEMTEYPASKLATSYTDALPQLALSACLALRLQITNLLGSNLNLATSAPHLLRLASELEKHLQSLPPPFRSSTRSGSSSNKRLHRLFTSIQLELSIRRPLLALYRAISMSEIGDRFPEARKGAVKNALAVLGNLDALDPAVADLSAVKGKEYLNLFHILHRSSVLQSALILCYEIKLYNSRSSTSSSSSAEYAQDREGEREGETDVDWVQSRVSFTRVIENTVKSLLDRIGGFGCDLKDILPLCVALCSVRCDGDAEERKKLMKRGAERVRDACRVVRPDVLIKFKTELTEGGGRGMCGGRGNEMPERAGNYGRNGTGGGDPLPSDFEMGFEGVDMIPDLGFENMDFGFFDWGTNQSWA